MATRVIGPTGSRRRRRFLLGPILLIAVVALYLSAGAQAVHDLGLFQLDRNALEADDGGTGFTGDDWDTLFLGGGSQDAFTGILPDVTPLPGGTQFQGGGSKDDLDITSWLWKPGEPLDKDDITNAYAAAYTNTVDTGENDVGDLIVYFGLDRFSTNGSAQVGFWFLQDPDFGLSNISSGGGFQFTGQHRDNDILVQSNFTNGGVISNLTVFKWMAGALVEIGSVAASDCVSQSGSDDPACATVNQSPTDAPWDYTPKANEGPPGTFQQSAFFEGGINITRLVPDATCFANFLAETRSSTPFDARLKDFAQGSFDTCVATIKTTPSAAAIELGQSITDKAVVSGAGLNAPTPTGFVKFFICSPTQLTNGTCASDGTFVDVGADEPDGEALTPDPNDATKANAESDPFTPDVVGTWCWRGEYSGDDFYDPVADSSTDECFNVVDAQIDVSPLNATNETGANHVVTATVQQDTGSGFVNAPDGTTVTFSLANNNAGAAFVPAGANTCTTTNGTCSVTITSTSTGTVDIHATTTFTVSGVSLTRSTGSGGNNSADANKRFVDAQIDLSPLTDTNGITETHTIEATVQQDDGLAANTGGGDAVTGFGPAPDGTTVTFSFSQNTIGAVFVPPGANTCTTTAGVCSIQITSSAAGTVLVNATTTFNIGPAPVEEVTRTTGTGGLNSADAEKIFVLGSLAWFKDDNAGNPLGGATFQVCRTADRFGNPVTGECQSVTDNSAPDTDTDAGEFKLEGLKFGHYTVEETAAPPGYEAVPGTKTADLTLENPDATISVHFTNERPIVKISGFGYTNTAQGTPTHGVVSGVATYTVDLHNFGGASATITSSSITASATGGGAGTLECDGDPPAPALSKAISGSIGAGGDLATVTLVCTYTNMDDGAVIAADLIVKYTLNGLERTASGSPAKITFTVQGD